MSISAIVLAGGFGSRLKSISKGLPKALMPINDNNIYLDILLDKIFKYAVSHVYLSIYYKSDLFSKYMLNSKFSKKITCVTEPEPLGTGGAIKYVINNTKIGPFFYVINGDSYSDINLDKMLDFYNKNNFISIIGGSYVKNTFRYGKIMQREGRVQAFEEKGVSGKGLINNGYYIMNSKAFNQYEGKFSLEKTLFPNLIKNKNLGILTVNNDNFIDMGIPEDYLKICTLYRTSNGI